MITSQNYLSTSLKVLLAHLEGKKEIMLIPMPSFQNKSHPDVCVSVCSTR